jgi:hypothetical protein
METESRNGWTETGVGVGREQEWDGDRGIELE